MASRFQKMMQAIEPIGKDYNTSWLTNQGNITGENNPDVMTYSKSDIVYVCVSTNARAISQVPLKVYNGEEFVEDHPWNVRLRNPNYLLNMTRFLTAICTHLQIEGEIFCVPFPWEYTAEVPESLFLIPSASMLTRKNDQGGLIGWKYLVPGSNDINFDIGQVCHFWFYNPYDPFRGHSPLKAGKIPVGTDYKASKYNQIFFDKGALNSGLITTDQSLSPQQLDKVQEKIQEKFNTGNQSAHQLAVLQKGLHYESMGSTHKDMEFGALKDQTRESIMQIFGVRKSIISETKNINRAVSETEKQNWWESTLLPITKLIEEALTFTFFGIDSPLQFKFDTSNVQALQKNLGEQVDIGLKLLQMNFTPNEINKRLDLGFEEKPWRNYCFVPFGTTPVGETIGVDQFTYEPERPMLPEPEEEPEEIEEESIIDITPKHVAKEIGRKQIEFELKTNHNTILLWKGIVKSTKPIERKFAERTKKAFFQMRKNVLRWVYDQQKNIFVLTENLSDIEKLLAKPMAQLKREADALYEESLMEGLRTLALELGIAPDADLLSRPDVVEYLKNKVAKLVRVSDTINNQVTNVIAEAVESELELDKVVEQLKERFNFARTRAKTVARTEVFGAVNHGRQVLMEESSFKRKKWFTAIDENVRTPHMEAHDQDKPIGKPFIVGGEELMHPGDPEGSAGNIINCRCIHTVAI